MRADVVPHPTTWTARIARLGLRLCGGWRFVASPMPPERAVMLALPHTTNLDGVLLVLMTRSIGMPANWMVKDFWLRAPFGWVTRRVGAVPVDRRQATGMVGQMVERFDEHETFHLLVPPEGTRRRVDHWKSGFYRIAVDAEVAVVPTFLDYRSKTAGFGDAMTMTGDAGEDMDRIRAYYDGLGGAAMAKHPEKFGPMRLRDEG